MNKQSIIQYIDKKFQKATHKEFSVGDTIRAYVKIVEGDTTRVQAFEGTVIKFHGEGAARMFTIRKISFGVGVERIFPVLSPNIEKIDVIRSGHVRRAKLYYLRDRLGRSARLEEKEATSSDGKKGSEEKGSPILPSAPELVSTEKK